MFRDALFPDQDKCWQNMIIAARLARRNSIAPITKLQVGAAVLVDNKYIFRGIRLELPTLIGSSHAIPGAITAALAHGHKNITGIAICADNGVNPHWFQQPCPHCWQSIFTACDLSGHSIDIVSVQPTGDRLVITTTSEMQEIMPLTFNDIGVDVSKWRKHP